MGIQRRRVQAVLGARQAKRGGTRRLQGSLLHLDPWWRRRRGRRRGVNGRICIKVFFYHPVFLQPFTNSLFIFSNSNTLFSFSVPNKLKQNNQKKKKKKKKNSPG